MSAVVQFVTELDGGATMCSAETTFKLFSRAGLALKSRGIDDNGNPFALVKRACGRCGGEGRSDRWAHTGYTCFECGGSGSRGEKAERLYTMEELERLNATAAKRQATRQANAEVKAERLRTEQDAAAAARRELLDASPLYQGLVALMLGYEEGSRTAPDFLVDMHKRIQHTDLTPGQAAAVQKFIDADAERRAKRAQATANGRHLGAPGDRIAFAGVVGYCKTIRSATAWESGYYLNKIVTHDGATIVYFGSRLLDQGSRICGKATIKELSTFDGIPQTVVRNPRFAAPTPIEEAARV